LQANGAASSEKLEKSRATSPALPGRLPIFRFLDRLDGHPIATPEANGGNLRIRYNFPEYSRSEYFARFFLMAFPPIGFEWQGM
jgi:hypothetical protein